MRTSLQRRADGRYVVRLTSNRMLNEPFVDLLLEANWNSGRIVRDYTVLLDPPEPTAHSRRADRARPHRRSARRSPRTAPRRRAAPRSAAQRPAPLPRAGTRRDAQQRRQHRCAAGSGDQQVTVQAGDTASKIAAAYKPADVSLDQMLVALLRANPNAFIGGNINRIKAGAVLDVPSAAQAGSVPAAEATPHRDRAKPRLRRIPPPPGRERARLRASPMPTARPRASCRPTSKTAMPRMPRRPTSSDHRKAAQSPASRPKNSWPKPRQAQDSSARVAELSKNISELNKLQAASGIAPRQRPAAPRRAGSTGRTCTCRPPHPQQPPAAARPAAPALPGRRTAPAPPRRRRTAPAAAPAATRRRLPKQRHPPRPRRPPSPAPAAAAAKPPSRATPAAGRAQFLRRLARQPHHARRRRALIALLVGFLLYRVLGRKRRDAGDSVFLESRMPKDSFFGASGGESVDTKNRGNSVVSSLSYSPSQLDAGDVDPVAEADVYLAYGRDLQAEEILREALRINPERTAIHLKLLEIHAKRRDLRAFEALATDVHKLTGGNGADWNRVVELGQDWIRATRCTTGRPRRLGSGGRRLRRHAGCRHCAATPSPAAAPAPSPVAEPVVAAAPPPAFVPSVAPLDFDLDLSKPPAPAPAPQPAPVNASLPAARNGR